MTNANGFQGTVENLEKIVPQLKKLRPEEIRQFNLSVPTVVSTSMRIWKAYKTDEGKFPETFSTKAFNPSDYKDFPERVGALWHLDTQLKQAVDPKGDVDGILTEIVPLHVKLGKAAVYVWGNDEELGPIVADIRAGGGHMDKAGDLTRYAALFEEHWAQADGNCNVVKEDLAAARDLSARLIDAMTAVPASEITQLRDTRDRAGEYLRRAVDDIRDAAAYIFRNDSESLERYPSLYTRGASKKKPPKVDIEAAAPQPTE